MTDSVHETYCVGMGAGWKTTAADAAIDLRNYFVSPLKRELSATLVGKPGSDSGTLAIKIQESPTSGAGDTGWADITGAAFTTLADSDTGLNSETIFFSLSTGTKHIRTYATVGGSAIGWYAAAVLNVIKRNA